MAKPHAKVDAVIIGMGWVGGIIASELTKAGLKVVGLERGTKRGVADFQDDHDELAYAIRNQLFQDTSKETWTLRHNLRETALPIRQLGSFLPGTGLGGAGVHWNGQTWRFHPRDFTIRDEHDHPLRRGHDPRGHDDPGLGHHLRRDGALLPDVRGHGRHRREGGQPEREDHRRQRVRGIPLEGFPVRPRPTRMRARSCARPRPSSATTRFRAVREPAGYLQEPRWRHARPVHLLRVLRALRLRGRREGRSDRHGDPARPQDRQARAAHACNAYQIKNDGKTAQSVLYYDAHGAIQEQPADIIVVASYVFNNVRLLLMSKLGKPYDPVSGTGAVGRNYAYQTGGGGATGYFKEKKFRRYMGSGARGPRWTT